MFFKIGVLKNLQFYLKNTATQVFSCEIFETFGNSLFHRAFLVAAFVISETESKNEKNIFTWTYSPENSSEGVLFNTIAALTANNFLRASILDVFCDI